MNISSKIIKNDDTKTANSTRILKCHENHSIFKNGKNQHIFIEEREVGGGENEFSFD